MKAKLSVLFFVVFIVGCGQNYNSNVTTSQKISKSNKIMIGEITCNTASVKDFLEESLKQELQKKGYTFTGANADIVISGSATFSTSSWDYLVPCVKMAVIYVKDSNSNNLLTIRSRAGWLLSETPEGFAKRIAKIISKKL